VLDDRQRQTSAPASGTAPGVTRGVPGTPVASQPYDKRKLSYAGTFPNPWKAGTIRTMEWATGKLTLLRMIRRFEAIGVPQGQAFWAQALQVMGIALETPAAEIARIPRDGPLIVVANHPHGLVDGMVLAALIGQVRQDYKILTRSLLTEVDEIRQFMIPVPFPHEDDAQERSLDMRRQAMAHLAAGGVVALFPSGAVASSDTLMGPAVERPWNPFTAKMIQRSGAAVLPVRFPGQNSRAYQIAARLSATLRQGLLLHEVVHATGRPQAPVVGRVLPPADLRAWANDPRGLMGWLRATTLALDRG